MSLRFGSGWLVIYFLICSCTFICSAPPLRARDYTTFNPFEPLPFSVTPDTRGFGSLDREGAPQAVVAWGLFRIPKGLKCVERREAGRGAGVHAPQAEFTFRTYCRLLGNNPSAHPDGLPLALIGIASARARDFWGRQDGDGPGHFR